METFVFFGSTLEGEWLFLPQIGTKEECNRILQTDPWLFDGRLIILKQWFLDIGLESELLPSVSVWVRFSSLHLKFW